LLFVSVAFSYSQTLIPITDEIILPQYAVIGTGTNNRMHYVCRLKLTGLIANVTYKYYVGATTSATTPGTLPTPGNFYGISNTLTSSGYIVGYSSSKTINGNKLSGNEFSTSGRYYEFTTDEFGSYEGWFAFASSSNAVFNAGNNIYLYIHINNGSTGTNVAQSFRTTSTIHMLNYGTTPGSTTQATAFKGATYEQNEVMIFIYDVVDGKGRPIFGTWNENDSITVTYNLWYPDGISGSFGAALPNYLPDGIRRVESRNVSTGAINFYNTDDDGIWNGINTINPNGGTTAISFTTNEIPLPVTMKSFSSRAVKNTVYLNWVTSMEINNSGFDVERSADNNTWSKIGFVQGNNTSNQEHSYSFTDNYLSTGIYYYRLKQIDYNGNFQMHKLMNTVAIGKPSDFSLAQNYPNPSNPGSNINFSLPLSGIVSLKVYDVTGREIKTMIDGYKEAGFYSEYFDGSSFASGVYFYRLILSADGEKFSATKKFVLKK
jgi:hypothetical protein